jgi:putative hydrolase of the HAD superfamily
MLNVSKIKAITLDLDDTLWPVWPTIGRAEAVLTAWLTAHAPSTAALSADAELKKAVHKYNTYRPHKNLNGLTPMQYINNNLLEAVA